jgi:hypothetical protein
MNSKINKEIIIQLIYSVEKSIKEDNQKFDSLTEEHKEIIIEFAHRLIVEYELYFKEEFNSFNQWLESKSINISEKI